MRIMNRNTKSYVQYFFKSNRRLLILMCVGLFIIMPFAVFNSAVGHVETDNSNLPGLVFVFSLIGTFIVAGTMPMFTWRFLYKKTSCNMYFSLPITRKKFFVVQYLLGAVFGLIPLYLNFILEFLLLGFFTSIALFDFFVYFVLLLIPFFITYTIFTLVAVKCNNFPDAVVMSGAYLILPFVLFLAIVLFMDYQALDLLIANTSTSLINEVMPEGTVLSALSFPVSLTISLAWFVFDEFEMAYESIVNLITTGVWCLLGIVAFYISMRAFILRKEEEAQHRTTSYLMYPFVVTVLSVALILILFTSDLFSSSMFIMGTIIFALYIIMRLFARRSLKIKITDIGGFMGITAATLAFVLIFQSTHGFGLVKEYPDTDDFRFVNIYYSSYNNGNSFEMKIPEENIEEFLDWLDGYLEEAEKKDTHSIDYPDIRYSMMIDYQLDRNIVESTREYWDSTMLDYSDLKKLAHWSSSVRLTDCSIIDEDGCAIKEVYNNDEAALKQNYEAMKSAQ